MTANGDVGFLGGDGNVLELEMLFARCETPNASEMFSLRSTVSYVYFTTVKK